jgi:hypothetical protein
MENQENQENQDVYKTLLQERDKRAAELLQRDPVWSRLQGAIDYAEGNWKLRSDEEASVSQDAEAVEQSITE